VWAPWHSAGRPCQTAFKRFQTRSNIDRLKNDLPELENFEKKYGYEEFEEGNNFLHMNVLRFGMDFKLKIREAPRFRIQ
jgi:hypothetical protein